MDSINTYVSRYKISQQEVIQKFEYQSCLPALNLEDIQRRVAVYKKQLRLDKKVYILARRTGDKVCNVASMYRKKTSLEAYAKKVAIIALIIFGQRAFINLLNVFRILSRKSTWTNRT